MVAHQFLALLVRVRVLARQQNILLSCGVMVAHQFLALLVRVRVLAGQQKKDAFQRLFLFIRYNP